MSDFDPDAYLASKAAAPGPAFDPDAYLAAKAGNLANAGAARPDRTITAALGRGAAQGATLGFGDEIQGAIQAALPVAGDAPTFAERYQQQRDAARAENEKAKEAHSTAYLVGNVGGGAVTAPLLVSGSTPAGAGLLARAAIGAARAAPAGAIYGLGESTATTPGGIVHDTAVGAAGAGALGALAPVAGAGAQKLLRKGSEALQESAVKLGRNAIAGVTNSLARRKPLDVEAVEQAFKVGAIKPGLTVEGIASRLQDAADPLSSQYAKILADLEAKGVHGPEAEKLALSFLSDAQTAVQNSAMGGAAGGARARALRETGQSIGQRAVPISGQGRLGLMQSELMKRELQNAAATDFVKEGALSNAGHARKEIAGRVREAIEEAVQQQAAKAPAEAAAFEPVKEELHRTLQALGAAREGAARYARRTPFGLHEAIGMASGIATGNPLEAATAAGIMHGLKDRGASTGAWLAHRGAEDLGRLARLNVPGGPGVTAVPLSPQVAAMLKAMRSGRPGLAPAAAEEEGP